MNHFSFGKVRQQAKVSTHHHNARVLTPPFKSLEWAFRLSLSMLIYLYLSVFLCDTQGRGFKGVSAKSVCQVKLITVSMSSGSGVRLSVSFGPGAAS